MGKPQFSIERIQKWSTSTQYMGKDAADALGDALKASARTARDLNDLLSSN